MTIDTSTLILTLLAGVFTAAGVAVWHHMTYNRNLTVGQGIKAFGLLLIFAVLAVCSAILAGVVALI